METRSFRARRFLSAHGRANSRPNREYLADRIVLCKQRQRSSGKNSTKSQYSHDGKLGDGVRGLGLGRGQDAFGSFGKDCSEYSGPDGSYLSLTVCDG